MTTATEFDEAWFNTNPFHECLLRLPTPEEQVGFLSTGKEPPMVYLVKKKPDSLIEATPLFAEDASPVDDSVLVKDWVPLIQEELPIGGRIPSDLETLTDNATGNAWEVQQQFFDKLWFKHMKAKTMIRLPSPAEIFKLRGSGHFPVLMVVCCVKIGLKKTLVVIPKFGKERLVSKDEKETTWLDVLLGFSDDLPINGKHFFDYATEQKYLELARHYLKNDEP